MPRLFDIDLVPVSVSADATFFDAANTLVAHPVSTIAVVDGAGHVVGLFDGADLLEGLFPAYLKELHHTVFVRDDVDLLDRRAREVGGDPVERHMRRPLTVDAETSATHVAELFLHCGLDALPVVESGRFVGMLGRSEFCQALLHRPADG